MSDNENRTINFSDNFNEEKKNKEIKKFLNILKQSFNNFVNSNENKLKNLNSAFNITKNNSNKTKNKNKKKLFHIETDYVSINCEDYSQSFFCLINAPWGSGKTYFIEQLASFINKENNNNEIFIKFDLLDICKPEYNVNEVIYEIFKALYSKLAFYKISKKIRKIKKIIVILKCLKFVPFVPIFCKLIDWKEIMDYFIKKLTQISLDKGINFFNKQNKKLCILVLDNIERIGTNWYDIFRGIKRFLKFNNFIFIIPVDIKNLYISNSSSEQTELFIKKFINIKFDFNQDIKSMIINNLSEFHPNDEKIDFIYEMFSPNCYEMDKRKFNQLLSENKSYFKEIINISQNSIEIIEKIICGWEENKIKFNFDHFISINKVIEKVLSNIFEDIFKDLEFIDITNDLINFYNENFSSRNETNYYFNNQLIKQFIFKNKDLLHNELLQSKNFLFFIILFSFGNSIIEFKSNIIVSGIKRLFFLLVISRAIILNYEEYKRKNYKLAPAIEKNIYIIDDLCSKLKKINNYVNKVFEKHINVYIPILNELKFEDLYDEFYETNTNNGYNFDILCAEFENNFFYYWFCDHKFYRFYNLQKPKQPIDLIRNLIITYIIKYYKNITK